MFSMRLQGRLSPVVECIVRFLSSDGVYQGNLQDSFHSLNAPPETYLPWESLSTRVSSHVIFQDVHIIRVLPQECLSRVSAKDCHHESILQEYSPRLCHKPECLTAQHLLMSTDQGFPSRTRVFFLRILKHVHFYKLRGSERLSE